MGVHTFRVETEFYYFTVASARQFFLVKGDVLARKGVKFVFHHNRVFIIYVFLLSGQKNYGETPLLHRVSYPTTTNAPLLMLHQSKKISGPALANNSGENRACEPVNINTVD